jgi:hypothetical protein
MMIFAHAEETDCSALQIETEKIGEVEIVSQGD